MFAYCTEGLHLSEGAAYHRITAARAARKYTVILDRLEAGAIHLSGITVLAPHLTPENHLELLSRATHRSKRAIEGLVADWKPRPSVPARIRRLPVAAARRVDAEAVSTGAAPRDARAPMRRPDPLPEPLGLDRFKVQFTASRETHAKLQEVRALLRHQIPDGDLGRILDRAVDLLLDHVKRNRFGKTGRPRAARSSEIEIVRAKASRHIPLETRRAVVERDGGRCSYVGTGGRQCGSQEFLEFHHADPWARSRKHSVERIVLLCRAHNQYEGEQVYGTAHMERFRNGRTGAWAGTPPGGS
jgi:5-methylcytosine-specific restriction endonuclease McrA